jgi:hypothetical protein
MQKEGVLEGKGALLMVRIIDREGLIRLPRL